MRRFEISPFTKTKITFTLWYSLILFVILVALSAFIYTLETQDVTRIVLLRDYGTNVPKKLSNGEKKEIILQINEVKKSFIIDLVLVDDLILLLGAGLSFFLSGITLKPIQKSFQRQKEFIADASHELRTPLAAIQTAAEVALRNNTKTKENYKKVIEQTYKESLRMSKMVDELLTLSRADTGMVKFVFGEVELDTVLKDVIEETKPLILQKKLYLKNNLIEKTKVSGDSNKIKQLALIIMDNAIKYTPRGGNIQIKSGGKRRPFFSITDSGIGIFKEEQKKIFYRFYQVDRARSHGGAGLGLSIAKWIADSHKAEIIVKSNPGKETSFKVIFNS